MARIRTIKPEFNTSESVARLSRDSQLFFVKLLVECDDYGRIRWLPKKIAGDLYPLAEDVGAAQIEAWAAELEREDIFALYEVDGSTYGRFKNWERHQRVDKPGKSSIPEPPGDGSGAVSLASRESVAKVSRSDLGVRPRKGKGNKEKDSATLAAASGAPEEPLIPELIPEPDVGQVVKPYQEVEAVLKGVALRLETPDPTSDEVRRYVGASSPVRRLAAKYGIPGAVDLACYAMTHSPGCGWARVWEANASYASQMRKGVESSFTNGRTETLAEASRRLANAGH